MPKIPFVFNAVIFIIDAGDWLCYQVLSVARALSIQAHPDKALAGFLHTLKPSVYKDASHKPEMVLAVTEFEALCGFISSEVIIQIYFNFIIIIDIFFSPRKLTAWCLLAEFLLFPSIHKMANRVYELLFLYI